jgi:hypothetical protein
MYYAKRDKLHQCHLYLVGTAEAQLQPKPTDHWNQCSGDGMHIEMRGVPFYTSGSSNRCKTYVLQLLCEHSATSPGTVDSRFLIGHRAGDVAQMVMKSVCVTDSHVNATNLALLSG